jgi:hypothetical protein
MLTYKLSETLFYLFFSHAKTHAASVKPCSLRFFSHRGFYVFDALGDASPLF